MRLIERNPRKTVILAGTIIHEKYLPSHGPKSVKHWYGIVLVIDARARQVRFGRMFTTGQELGQTLEDALTIQKPQAGSR